jgi:hypothetical protein
MRPRLRALALLAATGAATLAACDRAPGGGTKLATVDSVATLTQRLAEAEKGVKQRDAMMAELAQTSRLVGEIDSALSSVKGLEAARKRGTARRAGAGESSDPWVSRRDSVMGRVQTITRMLAQSRARVAELQRQNRSMDRSANDFRATIAQLEATVERQQRELAALTATADSLRTAGQQYAAERDATRDTLTTTRDAANSVYYVVGQRRELLAKRLVTEEGAKRFLVAGRRTNLVPVRGLDPSTVQTAFQAADQRRDVVITLPDPNKGYRVVSRHDPALLVPGKRADGTPDGTLHVAEPQRFWNASKFLIIVQN